MTAPGRRTRERLLDVAEQLFGERGIEAVSLREIRLAAGARNSAAVQFHFENRAGLLEALTARHMPKIAAMQRDLFDTMVAEGRENDPRSLVEVLVRPAAVYVFEGSSERAWVKIMADVVKRPELLDVADMISIAPEIAQKVGAALYAQLAGRVPAPIAQERIVSLAQMSLHLSADRARVEDGAAATRARLTGEEFVENVVDMVCGSFFAPNTHRSPAPD